MSASGLRLESLLLSSRVEKIRHEPFSYFCIDNYVPQDTYQEMLRGFPDKDQLVRSTAANKRMVSSRSHPEIVQDLFNQFPVWKRFFDLLNSEVFIRDVNRFLRRGLFKSRGLRGLKVWRDTSPVASSWLAKLIQPVQLQFEFSQLYRDSHIPPHTDSGSKLLSLCFYLADSSWQDSYGGGTEFYRPKNSGLGNNWSNEESSFEEMDRFYLSGFAPNRMVGFLKSENSYHGVPPIKCPEGMARNSLNINFLTLRS